MSIIISYDISNNELRSSFSKMLTSNGAIRIQFSVYEFVNTKRVTDNMMLKIERFAKHFSADDSVIIFNIDKAELTKYGNAIHRDRDILYF